MGLIANLTQQKPGKLTLNREELIGLIQSDAKFIDEREDIAAYIRGLPVNEALNENRFEQALNTSRQKRRRKNSLRSPPDMTLHQMPCKFLLMKFYVVVSLTVNAFPN